MTDMIDRVAKALGTAMDYGNMDGVFAETVHRGDCTNEPFTCFVCLQEELREYARAAIEAMMGPTEEMRIAGLEALVLHGEEEQKWWKEPEQQKDFDSNIPLMPVEALCCRTEKESNEVYQAMLKAALGKTDD